MELNVADTIKLAASVFQDGHYEEAERLFRAASAVDPDNAYASQGLGMALMELDRPKEALEWYDRSFLVMRNDMAALMLNRTRALADGGRLAEALALIQNMLRSEPHNGIYLFQRGLILMQMGRYQECIVDMDTVLKKDPENEKALFARGFANLVLGNYEEGFRDYEHRLKHPIDPIDQPEWTGEQDISGKTILVHGDMGFGDNIMFMRFVPELVARGARVVVVVDNNIAPLVPEGVQIVGLDRGGWPEFDYWIRFMSLAYALRITRETVPAPLPVKIEDTRLEKFKALLDKSPNLKVGLCWAGSIRSKYDVYRSIPLEQLAVLFSVPGVDLFSLQQDVRPYDEAAFEHLPIKSLGEHFETYADTAAAMSCLDLVITVDTSVAHIAGTVGVPTFVMLTSYRSYWVWMDGLKGSPWYSSVKVLRQEEDNDWSSVIKTLHTNLTRLGAKRLVPLVE